MVLFMVLMEQMTAITDILQQLQTKPFGTTVALGVFSFLFFFLVVKSLNNFLRNDDSKFSQVPEVPGVSVIGNPLQAKEKKPHKMFAQPTENHPPIHPIRTEASSAIVLNSTDVAKEFSDSQMASTSATISTPARDIFAEIITFIKGYKNGTTIKRPEMTPIVPPTIEDPKTGVSSKDIVISYNPSISARLYLPKSIKNQKVPILLYFHGGAFIFESAFNQLYHNHLNVFVSQAKVLAISVEYRLAPENPLPAAYEDSWAALKWVATHSIKCSTDNTEPWLMNHGDFNKIYLGGDSAGANIVHNLALRSGVEALPGDVKLLGAFLSYPYFWGSKPIGSEPTEGHEESFPVLLWNFAYPNAVGGIDNSMINPLDVEAPSLVGLGCSKMLVCVAEKDIFRDRGVWYYVGVNKSGWKGEVELYEVEDEGHIFHIFNSESENGLKMIKRLVSFLSK